MGDENTAHITTSERTTRNQGADQILDRIGFPYDEDGSSPDESSRTPLIILRETFPVNGMARKALYPILPAVHTPCQFDAVALMIK